jgi:hypothetical protein
LNQTLPPPVSAGTLTRFFVPLAIQASSQALCYPLVAMVASRGPGGPLNLAGLAQANMVMFFFGMFALSYVTTGMVFAKTRDGYRKFRLVTLLTGVVVIIIQAILCTPPLAHFIFGKIIGLPPSIEQPARTTFLVSIPLQFLFFLRIPNFVVMYIGKATGMASLATIGRIALTALLSPVFCNIGLVGPVWAVVCLTIPVAVEVLVSRIFATPFLKSLESTREKPPRAREIFLFNLPLSIGGYFLSVSAIILAGFIARAPDPGRILPVYYLALGLANPMAFAATRIQTIVLAFPPQSAGDRRTVHFALAAGFVLGLVPLIFALPGLIELYYVTLQKLNPQDLVLVRLTAVSLIFFPFAVAIRAQSEGLAAWQKKPVAVLTGHAFFMATIVATGFSLLKFGVPGHLIGPTGLTLGSLMSSAAMRIFLKRTREGPVPVGQTTTSVGQIR